MYKSLHTCCKSLKYDVVKSLSSTHQGIYWQVLQCDGALMSLTRYLTTRQEGFILLLDIGPAYWHRHSGSWALKQLGLAHTRILLIWKLISSDKSEQLLPYRVLGLWIISSLQLATKRVDVHSGGTPGAWCLVTVRIGAGHLVWRWRVAGCQHRATGIISQALTSIMQTWNTCLMMFGAETTIRGEGTLSFVLIDIEGAYKCLHF